MIKTIILPSLLLLFGSRAIAQELKCVKGVADYDFWIYLPEKSVMKSKPPVLIFLHGQNLCGSNLKYLTEGKTKGNVKKPPYGTICEIKNRDKEFPAIVVGPQFPEGSRWEPDKLLDVLDYIQRTYDTDISRVYVTGMSAGGFGTLRFAGKYPERITAAAALCGGGDLEDACNLSRVPLWIMCGTNDSKYFVTQSKQIADAIKKCDGGDLLRFNLLRGKNHSDMEEYFRTTDTLYNWLFSQRKNAKQDERKNGSSVSARSVDNERPQKTETTPVVRISKNQPFYIVNIIAVSRETVAKVKAAELKKAGHAADYLWIPDYTSLSGKPLYTVYIGPYGTQKECEAATEKLKKNYNGAYGTKVSQDKDSVYIKGIGEVITTKKE